MKSGKFFLVSLAVIAIDQLTKLIVKFNLDLRDGFNVLGEFFQIYFIENDGAAFGTTIDGMLENIGIAVSPETGKVILSLFSIIAVCGIGYMLHRLANHRSALPFYLALIFGGAVGNIIDRTFYGVLFHDINLYDGALLRGQVVDMFYFDIYKGGYPTWLQWLPWVTEDSYLFIFPVFNVADAAISIGICVILVFQSRFFKQDAAAKQNETQDSIAKERQKANTSSATSTQHTYTDFDNASFLLMTQTHTTTYQPTDLRNTSSDASPDNSPNLDTEYPATELPADSSNIESLPTRDSTSADTVNISFDTSSDFGSSDTGGSDFGSSDFGSSDFGGGID
jgi:signal peptidase II